MIQALADGILTGAIIALGAIGVTFTLEIMRFANFAHSELLTWGAYIALIIVTFAGPGTPTGPLSFGWQLLAAALIAAVLTGLAAWAVDTLVFRRLRRRGALPLTMVFAGVFTGLTPQLHPEIGFNLLLSLFAAAILGGTGSLAGAVTGGFLVGLAENLSLLVISPGYKGAMPFLLLLAILILRPQGLFGARS